LGTLWTLADETVGAGCNFKGEDGGQSSFLLAQQELLLWECILVYAEKKSDLSNNSVAACIQGFEI
jgi:hypothetical protein